LIDLKMVRAVKITMEQWDDGSVDAWFTLEPSLRIHADGMDELLAKLAAAKDEWVAHGGDPLTLAEEDADAAC